jgi:hypothetical protein
MLDYIMRAPQTACTYAGKHILYKQFTQLTGMHASLAISSSVQSVLFSLVLFRINFDSCSDTYESRKPCLHLAQEIRPFS